VSSVGARHPFFDALRHLPDRQAEVIVLSFHGELTLSEIAVRLEIPTGTAKGRVRLGLEKLRAEWLQLEGRNVGRVIR
jgi:RNA polymerase sigma factor (sigma-70 family)